VAFLLLFSRLRDKRLISHTFASGIIRIRANDQRVNERYKMRRLLLFAIFIQLLFSANLAQSKMDAFSGSWLRDEVIQRNGRPLPRVTWQVAFDEKTMTLTERGEDGKVSRTVQYNLDGTETQTKPDFLHKFRWDAERQVIQLSDRMVGSDNPPKMGLSIIETWQLSDGGKVLKILRKFEPTDKTIPIRMADVAYSFRRIE
jgi:hypothetical protein